MTPYRRPKAPLAILSCLTAILGTQATLAYTLEPASEPLFLSVLQVKPNIMLMVDTSYSMNTQVLDPLTERDVTPADAPADYIYSCPAPPATPPRNQISPGAANPADAPTIMMTTVQMPGGLYVPRLFATTDTAFTNPLAFGNKSFWRCFVNSDTAYYRVAHINGTDTSLKGTYTGRQLNWYFNTNSNLIFFPETLGAKGGYALGPRIDLAKTAARDFVNAVTPAAGKPATIRLGLSTYNGDNGGALLAAVQDLDQAHANTILDKIGTTSPATGLSAPNTTNTPLAETLSDIGHYFATGYSGNLTLHPTADSPTTASVADVFNNHSLNNQTGLASLPSPIERYCQKSFAVLVSDGLPSTDRNISTYLQDYDNDCHGDDTCKANNYDMKCAFKYPGGNGSCSPAIPNPNDTGGTSGVESSDYLDDVAKALYEMDLRPDLTKPTPKYKNNLVTYTVGFVDKAIDPTVPGTNPLLADTATNGGGSFFFSANSTALSDALKDTITEISGTLGSSASVAANSSRAEGDTLIYQARFDSSDWTGSFLAYPIDGSGSIGGYLWDAADNIPQPNDRTILTYNTELNSGKGGGAEFKCASLSASQKSALGIGGDCASASDVGIWLLNYLRGDYGHEQQNTGLPANSQSNTKRADTEDADPGNDAAKKPFRNRAHLDLTTHLLTGRDPWLLGDIVSSNPAYVGTEDYAYDELDGAEGTSYATFRNSSAYKARRPMVYVGANDGMLHGFDARGTVDPPADQGKEIVAYIPNALFSKLPQLASPTYKHAYFVEGSPRVADAYFGGEWHTALVGATGTGGNAVFALDVTDPSSFATSKVLWEISTSHAPTASDLTDIAWGFTSNLGYTMAQPSIVRMADGSWAAIVANGYGSVNNKAVLYIVSIGDGHVIKAFNTGSGDADHPNGLSTPIAIDADGNRSVDYIYAGDLLGNLWKFDVSSESSSGWAIANSGSPLFVTCDSNSAGCAPQPITSKPQVGRGPSNTGLMVYFGTGKYFEKDPNPEDEDAYDPDDNTDLQNQSLYGIWDNGATVSRGQLQVQTIDEEITRNGLQLRRSSRNAVSYGAGAEDDKGWYMDLRKPGTPPVNEGERVVYFPLLRNGRIIFTTLIPTPPDANQDPCGTGSNGTGWLMELNALDGQPLPTGGPAPWDVDGDGDIDADDKAAGGDNLSGLQSQIGIPTTPAIVNMTCDETSGETCLERKYSSGSKDAQLGNISESRPPESSQPPGRQAWRQLR